MYLFMLDKKYKLMDRKDWKKLAKCSQKNYYDIFLFFVELESY